MHIWCFPILGFLRTFSRVFWGPHRNSLWQTNLLQFVPSETLLWLDYCIEPAIILVI